MLPPGPIVSLVYRVPPSRRAELLAFLRDAVPFHERPGGIRVGWYESADEPGLFLELVVYASEGPYAADQDRVEHDPAMLAVLERFRAVVGGPVEVRRMKPVLDLFGPRGVSADVEPAAFNDHAAIAELLTDASLPLPDAVDVPVRMLVAREGGRVIGCAGWEHHGEAALLRSVAVRSEARRRGVGAALVRAALVEIAATGAREAVLLTTDAEAFFAGLGFTPVDRRALPTDVRSARQVTTQCCASAVCMRRAPCD
jgi:amino-acid N-acetyltransferase